jgi:hypothetical protein
MALQLISAWFMVDVTIVLAWSAWRANVGSNE